MLYVEHIGGDSTPYIQYAICTYVRTYTLSASECVPQAYTAYTAPPVHNYRISSIRRRPQIVAALK